MICELCASMKQECKPLQKQHLEMLKNIDAGNAAKETKSNDNKCICVQCEQMLIGKYLTKLQQETEKEKLQMQLEKEKLKEILKNLKNGLDDTPASSNCSFSEQQLQFHEANIKIEKSEHIELIDIKELSWKNNTTMEMKEQQHFDNTNNSSCSFSGNCDETKIKIEKSEIMDVEVFNSAERWHDQEELKMQQQFDTQSSSSSCSFLENGHEAEITIEKSEVMDAEEISWQDNTTMEMCNSSDGCYDEVELNVQQQFNRNESDGNSDGLLAPTNVTKPQEKMNWSGLIKKIEDDFYCCTCGESSKKYLSRSGVKAHIQMQHMGYRFTCTKCNHSYKERRNLKHHYKTVHNITNGLIAIGIPEQPSNKSVTNENPLEMNATKTLENIVAKVKSKTISKAEEDYYLFSLIKKLDDAFYCDICGESANKYMFRADVVSHIKLNHIGYRFTCTECKFKFTNKRCLKNHYKRKHNINNGLIAIEIANQPNYKPVSKTKRNSFKNLYKKIGNSFECTLCNIAAKYNSTSGIRHHIQTVHYGHRYECSICSTKFLSPGALKIHTTESHNIVPKSMKLVPASSQTNDSHKLLEQTCIDENTGATTSGDCDEFIQKIVNE